MPSCFFYNFFFKFFLKLIIILLNVSAPGNWTDWYVVADSCSVTCGNGSETEQRNCTNPAPWQGGLECLKEDGNRGMIETRQQPCSRAVCISKFVIAVYSVDVTSSI